MIRRARMDLKVQRQALRNVEAQCERRDTQRHEKSNEGQTFPLLKNTRKSGNEEEMR